MVLSGTGTIHINTSKFIKYDIFSLISERAIRGPMYYKSKFRIFKPSQDDQISCPSPSSQKNQFLFHAMVPYN
jgi:hypothetical protein